MLKLRFNIIEQAIFTNGDLTLTGSIPIQLKAYADPEQSSEASKIEFKITEKVRLGNKK